MLAVKETPNTKVFWEQTKTKLTIKQVEKQQPRNTDQTSISLNTLVLGVSLTASTSPEDGHAGNQQISGPSGASKIYFFPKII